MKILVVGGGGREHAIIRKLRENPEAETIYCAPGNGGIAADAECVPIKATDLDGMVAFAKEHAVDLAVVAPDDPLALGMVDAMNAAGVRTFGPNKAAARIEGSKVFAKNLMEKYGIPTAKYRTFDSASEAVAYIETQNAVPTVVKADGLALGKGVVIARDLAEAKDVVRSIMEDKLFGASGNRIVVEEFLTGPEVSVLSFCDGETVAPMISSMDHKRAFDGDEAPTRAAWAPSRPTPATPRRSPRSAWSASSSLPLRRCGRRAAPSPDASISGSCSRRTARR